MLDGVYATVYVSLDPLTESMVPELTLKSAVVIPVTFSDNTIFKSTVLETVLTKLDVPVSNTEMVSTDGAFVSNACE